MEEGVCYGVADQETIVIVILITVRHLVQVEINVLTDKFANIQQLT